MIDEQLDDLMPQLPALLLDGPKAVGKTRTAEHRASTVWQLHRPAVAQVVSADPLMAISAQPPVLFDEYQKIEHLWDEVKDFVDRDLSPLRVLLTGSAPRPRVRYFARRVTRASEGGHACGRQARTEGLGTRWLVSDQPWRDPVRIRSPLKAQGWQHAPGTRTRIFVEYAPKDTPVLIGRTVEQVCHLGVGVQAVVDQGRTHRVEEDAQAERFGARGRDVRPRPTLYNSRTLHFKGSGYV